MDLSHVPVIQEFSATHGIAEVNTPVVSRIHIGHGGCDSTLGHHRMSFAQQRLAYDSNTCSLSQCLDGSAQASTTGADHQDVMLVSLVFAVHRSLTSLIRPAASMRT